MRAGSDVPQDHGRGSPGEEEVASDIKALSLDSEIEYTSYRGLDDLPAMMALIDTELSEPYTIYTYRYFLDEWPHLCYVARSGGNIVGAIICKQDVHRSRLRGYIAMLSIKHEYRGQGIGLTLAKKAIQAMKDTKAQEVILETEIDNIKALKLYGKLGFIRDKKLYAFYLNRKSAYRLVLPLDE